MQRTQRRIDTPAGGSHPTDMRMTTRFKEVDLTEGLTGAIQAHHLLATPTALRCALWAHIASHT